MTRRSNDSDALIELLGDRTRLNLRGSRSTQPAEAPAPPRPTRRNRRHDVEFTAMPGLASGVDEVFECPSCGAPGQLDIREGASGRCYLSCNSCFRMWQEVREPDRAFQLNQETLWQMR